MQYEVVFGLTCQLTMHLNASFLALFDHKTFLGCLFSQHEVSSRFASFDGKLESMTMAAHGFSSSRVL